MMIQAKPGDTVRVHYTGKLTDGTVLETSYGSTPLELNLGEGMVFPDFENAIMGMKPGESTTVSIPAGNAYGQYHGEMVLEIERENLPDNLDPEIGQMLELKWENEKTLNVMITNVSESTITVDANHPLAGRDLIFNIVLIDII
jgi:peptidylprolyl isomerase